MDFVQDNGLQINEQTGNAGESESVDSGVVIRIENGRFSLNILVSPVFMPIVTPLSARGGDNRS